MEQMRSSSSTIAPRIARSSFSEFSESIQTRASSYCSPARCRLASLRKEFSPARSTNLIPVEYHGSGTILAVSVVTPSCDENIFDAYPRFLDMLPG